MNLLRFRLNLLSIQIRFTLNLLRFRFGSSRDSGWIFLDSDWIYLDLHWICFELLRYFLWMVDDDYKDCCSSIPLWLIDSWSDCCCSLAETISKLFNSDKRWTAVLIVLLSTLIRGIPRFVVGVSSSSDWIFFFDTQIRFRFGSSRDSD